MLEHTPHNPNSNRLVEYLIICYDSFLGLFIKKIIIMSAAVPDESLVNKPLSDFKYPQGDEIGIPSRTLTTKRIYPNDIDWHKDLVIEKRSETKVHGVSRTMYQLSYSDDYRSRPGTNKMITRASQAIRSMLVSHVPTVANVVVEYKRTVVQGSLLELAERLKETPVLGVDVDSLDDYEKGAAFTERNSYCFRYEVYYDAERAQLPFEYTAKVAREVAAQLKIDSVFGVPDIKLLSTVPDILRPPVASFLDDGKQAPLQLTSTPAEFMQVYSTDAQWVPQGNQRQEWLRRRGYDSLSLAEQELKIQQEGPRLAPGDPIVKICRDDRVVADVHAVRTRPNVHGRNALGSLPNTRYPLAFLGTSDIRGDLAYTVARVCPRKCYSLTDDGGVLDIEDTATCLRFAQGKLKNVRLTLSGDKDKCDGLETCGRCKDLAPQIHIRDDVSSVFLFVDAHAAQTADEMMTRALQLLSTTFAVLTTK